MSIQKSWARLLMGMAAVGLVLFMIGIGELPTTRAQDEEQ
jgi:hypothetical protein